MDTWQEYAALVERHDAAVRANPCTETYRARWQARIAHPSWTEKRQHMIWLCEGRCEHCGSRVRTDELQLHHLHYETLWYENHSDLELLCPSCHRRADELRADEQARAKSHLSLEARIEGYMEVANRWSGQENWPVDYEMARAQILGYEE